MKYLFAPISGKIISLKNTTDPLFSEKMLGDGVAIAPDYSTQIIHAPVTGKITFINYQKYSISITSTDGLEVLMQIGTENSSKEIFSILCKIYQTVKAGQPLIKINSLPSNNGFGNHIIFVIITNISSEMLLSHTVYKYVEPKDILLTIH